MSAENSNLEPRFMGVDEFASPLERPETVIDFSEPLWQWVGYSECGQPLIGFVLNADDEESAVLAGAREATRQGIHPDSIYGVEVTELINPEVNPEEGESNGNSTG